MVGEVKKVDKKGHGVFQYAELMPSVDMTRLEEVFVVMEPLQPAHPQEEKKKKGKKTKK
jgi:cell shape-determining protein MreC